ncbi:uncharacterized protein LOC131029767 [Cryptomeria japonica]|uniref:uncharacterized protein LOC131029767 n=1 Tax=Cryptomeria japonica TaxID=3369 RepID=UPI0027DA3B7C|nr:uncharacterized protein LOC131029767 [Cryptomeria japonica]
MKKWLGLRIKLATSKGKQNNILTDNPQSKVHKEYTRRTQLELRKNASIDSEEKAEAPLTVEEPKKKLDERMKEVEDLAKHVSLGIIASIGATPQEEIHPVMPAIEGFSATTKYPGPEAQPSSTTTTATTSTTMTPDTTSTTSVATTMTTMPPPVVTTVVTPPSIVSQVCMPIMTPTKEMVIIHNME